MNSLNITSTTKNPFSDVPPNIVEVIHHFLIGLQEEHIDFREAKVRPSVANIYRFIVCMYALLVVTGVLCNLAVLFHILRHRFYKDPTYAFIINNVISDIVKCVCVVPISLYVLLVQNWMLGELLCSFLPMLQVKIISNHLQ